MHGTDNRHSSLFSRLCPENRDQQDHPLRGIRLMVDEALQSLSPRFEKLLAPTSRTSIHPWRLELTRLRLAPFLGKKIPSRISEEIRESLSATPHREPIGLPTLSDERSRGTPSQRRGIRAGLLLVFFRLP
jgi:hypothetical protein